MMYKAIRNKKIKVNRKRADFAQILQPDDVILLFLPDDVLVQKEKKVLFNSNLDVVYEDDNIVVADKPAGLLSQSAKEGQDCLVERLRAYLYRKASTIQSVKTISPPAFATGLTATHPAL